MFKHWKLPVVLTLVTGLMIGAAGTASAQTMDTDFTDIPIEGTIPGTANTFEGTLDVTRFAADGGTLIIGQLTGEITDADGALVATVNEAVQVPVDISQVSQQVCDILLLELGPIDLDLLGLVVNVSPITINIDAEQGPGNLLGNLLCAVAGLLDPDGASGLTQALARLLNRILSILG